VDEELEFHIAMETEANVRRGMTPEEAHRVALRDLGGVAQTREAVADVRRTFVDSLRQDVVYAMRGFRRTPGFTLVTLVVLALGIAANTTIFSVVNAVLLRPLPVSEPEGLRFLSVAFAGGFSRADVPRRTFEELARRGDVLGGVAGFSFDSAKLGNGANATRMSANGSRPATSTSSACTPRWAALWSPPTTCQARIRSSSSPIACGGRSSTPIRTSLAPRSTCARPTPTAAHTCGTTAFTRSSA
jgi:hypothetical protein